MKKILALLLALVMAVCLTACGEDNPAAAPDNSSSTAETEFVPMTFGYITVSVPSVFSAVTEKEGMYVSAGPDASIVVTPALEVELPPSAWDESLAKESLEMLYGATYTHLELSTFEGNVNMNGNTAIYYAFYGKNAAGKDRLAQVVRLFNADLTAQHMITLIHSAEDEFFTAEVGDKIINSITLSPDAQNLAYQSKG